MVYNYSNKLTIYYWELGDYMGLWNYYVLPTEDLKYIRVPKNSKLSDRLSEAKINPTDHENFFKGKENVDYFLDRDVLNYLGEIGWELVSVTAVEWDQDSAIRTFYFKQMVE